MLVRRTRHWHQPLPRHPPTSIRSSHVAVPVQGQLGLESFRPRDVFSPQQVLLPPSQRVLAVAAGGAQSLAIVQPTTEEANVQPTTEEGRGERGEGS